MKPTDWLAIYGAVLSTVVFVWNASRTTRRLKVKIVLGLISGEVGYHITLYNHSHTPVNARYIGLLYPYRRAPIGEKFRDFIRYGPRGAQKRGWVHSPLPDGVVLEIPRTIESGDSYAVFILKGAMHERIGSASQVIAYAQDALARNFYSAPMDRLSDRAS